MAYQNFFATKLYTDVGAADTTITLETPPTATSGRLVIEARNATQREIVKYTGVSGNQITGVTRGQGGTTAKTHLKNALVEMNATSEDLQDLYDAFNSFSGSNGSGWNVMANQPNTVVNNGNRSYTFSYTGVDVTNLLSPGTRLRTTRTVAAPTQCADLESGSSQYYSKTTPNKLAFTDDHTEMAWVKPESYVAGGIIARRNADTEGWSFAVNASGQLVVSSLRIASNNSVTTSYQSLPLGKWCHVAATTDLSGTSVLLYIDGVLVPSATVITGTITALVQGTTALVVGAEKSAGTNPFDGKIAQAAVFNAVLSAATIRSYMSQGLAGTETSLASAYSFNNSIVDLNTTTPNDLTASGSAVATNADSPFGTQASGLISSTLDYGIVTAATFSTDTTLVVQVPEGCTIPTSGGVSAVSYSGMAIPYGFAALSRFKLSAYDTSGTLTLPLLTVMVKHVTNNPLDDLIINSYSGSPIMRISQNGFVRTITGSTTPVGLTTSATFAIPFTQAPIVTCSPNSGGGVYSGFYTNSESTTKVDFICQTYTNVSSMRWIAVGAAA